VQLALCLISIVSFTVLQMMKDFIGTQTGFVIRFLKDTPLEEFIREIAAFRIVDAVN